MHQTFQAVFPNINSLSKAQHTGACDCLKWIKKQLDKGKRVVRVTIFEDSMLCSPGDTSTFKFETEAGIKIPETCFSTAHVVTKVLREAGYFVTLTTKDTTWACPEMIIRTYPERIEEIGGPTEVNVGNLE